MSRIMFIIIATSIYAGMNFYVIWNIFNIFQIKKWLLFGMLILWLTLLFPIWMTLHRLVNWWIFSKYIYELSAIWLWILTISIWIFVIYNLINLVYKNIYIWYSTIIIIVLLCSYALYNWRQLRTKEVDIKIPNLKQDTKIVYMSDIHIDTINDDRYITKIVNEIKKVNPKFVLINWDLIDWTSLTHHTFSWFNELNIPIYTTLWNHEIYMWKEFVTQLLADTKIQLLIDKKVEEEWIQILWSDELMWYNRKYDINKLEKFLSWANIDNKKPSILLVHEPVWTEISSKYWINLQFAGHTHAWQIWPFNYLVKLQFDYVIWLFKIWDLQLYVWPGTWLWWPPMRLWSNNEITVVNLIK